MKTRFILSENMRRIPFITLFLELISAVIVVLLPSLINLSTGPALFSKLETFSENNKVALAIIIGLIMVINLLVILLLRIQDGNVANPEKDTTRKDRTVESYFNNTLIFLSIASCLLLFYFLINEIGQFFPSSWIHRTTENIPESITPEPLIEPSSSGLSAEESSRSNSFFKGVGNLIYNGIVGLVSGVVASYVFYFRLLNLKPKVIVSSQIAKSKRLDSCDNDTYIVKIINKHKRDLFDIEVSFYFADLTSSNIRNGQQVGLYKMSEIVSRSPKYVEKFNSKDHKATYALQFTFFLEPEMENKLRNSESYISVSIISIHPISNFKRRLSRDYFWEQIVQGSFEYGESLRIFRTHD